MTVLKKICSTVTSIIVALVVAFAILLVVVRVAGIQVYSVISGSMEPTYHVGSLIYVKNVDASEIEVGDVITFDLNGEIPATHRVVRIDAENKLFYTKGDSNEAEDRLPVKFSSVIGTPVFTIPYLGYAVSFIQSPTGIYTAISIGALMFLLSMLPSLFKINPKEKTPVSAKTPEASHQR